MPDSRTCSLLLVFIAMVAIAGGIVVCFAPGIVPSTVMATVFVVDGLAGLVAFGVVLLAVPTRSTSNDPAKGKSEQLDLREEFDALKAEHQQLLEDKTFLQFLKVDQERERQIIALDLHDSILPYLTSSLMQLEAGIDRANGSPEFLESSIAMIRTSLQQTRRIMNCLSPSLTQDEGIVASIERLVRRFEAPDRTIEFRHDVNFDRLIPLAEYILVQTVREELDLIRQRTSASSVLINLRQHNEKLILSIASNAYPSHCEEDEQHWLTQIRQWAELLQGSVEMENAPDSGCVLRAELPLARIVAGNA